MRTGMQEYFVVGFLFCVGFWGAPVHGQNLEKAKREGEVVWYTPTAIEDSQRIIQGFEKKYPGIKVRLFRNRETALLPRIIAEKQSGRPVADVTTLRGIGYYQLSKRNLVQPYVSPESKNYPQGFKEPEGVLDRFLRHVLCLELQHAFGQGPAAKL